MKKNGLMGLILSAFFLTALAGSASAFVAGSDHDLTTMIPALRNTCGVCHKAHNAKDIPDTPLSNRTAPTGPYIVYSSPTLDATVEQPGGTDIMCFSCHDGTIALDTYGSKTGTQYITGSALLGTDLSKNHPISFSYLGAMALDSGLVQATDSHGTGLTDLKLFNGYMRCASCHDVHNNSGNSRMLRKSSSQGLCETCHNK